VRFGNLDAPLQLVSALSNLKRLELVECYVACIPATYTRLTHLSYSGGRDPIPPSTLTGLKEIVAACVDVPDLSNATGLTRLCRADASAIGHAQAAGAPLAVLRSLSSLQHLVLEHGCGHEELTVLGSLKRLTHLSLTYTKDHVYWWSTAPLPLPRAIWPVSSPLPALKELRITGYRRLCSLTAMSHWLVQLTALTSLSAQQCTLAGGSGQLCFPPQLQQLDLDYRWEDLQHLPCALQQLTALHTLSVRERSHVLCQLPSWLSMLRRLEALDLQGTEVMTEQDVLACMPALRYVRVPRQAEAAEVFGKATHLLFADVSRVWQY
jgi:hypothetical protein